jgi:hypothetical protein
MKVCIMQPYFFPYIGYYQLLQASDSFVFLDDVSFINRGWINRNNILVNGQKHLFTVPIYNASQNHQISELHHAIDERWKGKFYKTLESSYKKAPYYRDAITLIHEVIDGSKTRLLDLAVMSIIKVLDYLDMKPIIYLSSAFGYTRDLRNWDRMATICQTLKAKICVNPIGGMQLYTKDQFASKQIELCFLRTRDFEYKQFNNEFVPGLSMIDILMFNSPSEIKGYLLKYDLI